MDFINKQQCPPPVRMTQFRGLKHLFQIGNTRENRTDLNKMQIRVIRKQARQCRFANTGWSPKNERAKLFVPKHRPQGRIRGQNLRLTNYLVNRTRAQAFGQGLGTLGCIGSIRGKQIVHP